MIERYTNKEILHPCPPRACARSASPAAPWRSLCSHSGRLRLPARRLRLLALRALAHAPRRLRLLGARYARTPVACGSLRVGCASLPSARLRTLRVACGSLAWPSAKSVGAPPQLPTNVLADLQRRRRLRLPGRPIALSRNPSNSAMSAESDSRSIGIPVFSQPCTEYR